MLAALLGMWAPASADRAEDGNIRGVVADESNGVLPGVTVIATAAEGRILLTAVTAGALASGKGKHESSKSKAAAVKREGDEEHGGKATPDDDTSGKGTIRFSVDKPLPTTLVRKIVKARIAQQSGAIS